MISYSDTRNISLEAIRELYVANDWSAAKKPTFDSTIARLYQIAFDVDGPEERAALRRHGF